MTNQGPGIFGQGSPGISGLHESGNVNGYGVYGSSNSTTGSGVYGTSPDGTGVTGSSTTGSGVYGSSTGGTGVYGISNSGIGVTGSSIADSGVYGSSTTGTGVYGISPDGTGVYGTSTSDIGVAGTSTAASGVYGSSTTGSGVYGSSTTGDGVTGTSPDGTAVTGISTNGWAVQGISYGQNGLGVIGVNSAGMVGVYALGEGDGSMGLYTEGDGLALFAAGDATVSGNLSKGGGGFRIDHPLDPANKYLYHSFVESPDMMNVYNGNVILGSDGKATVELPDWFEALNRDFRYQLTSIGSLDPTCISRKVSDGSFEIMGSPQQEVSWQVTGIRQDAWANAHRVPLEVEKKAADRGRYLHADLFGGEPIDEIARGRRYRQRLPSRPESA